MKFTRLLYAALALLCVSAAAQTTAPVLLPHQTFVDVSGFPCARCALYSYVAGTTTPAPTYTDATGTTANPNPVVLDGAGGAVVWLAAGSYKFVLKARDGSTIWTVDYVSQVGSGTGGGGGGTAYMPTAGGSFTGPVAGTSITAASVNPAALVLNSGAAMTGNHGNGAYAQHSDGTGVNGNCVKFDAGGNTTDAGAPCGSGGGGGGTSWSSDTGGTNTTGTFTVGSGASMSTAGSGTIQATSLIGNITESQVTGLATDMAAKVPTTRNVNGHALSSDVTLGFSDITPGTFTYDGANYHAGAPVYIDSGFFLNPVATANNSTNYTSIAMNEYASYWNGTAAVTAQAQQYLWLGSGTTPQAIEDHYYPSGLTNISVLYAQNPANVATVGVSVNTPKFILRGATWNGSASQLDNWNLQGVEGVGTNPTSTLTITHNGSSGSAIVSMPALTITGGTPGIQLTAAAFATYPACSGANEGLEEAVTDSTTVTWGATVTGGGANHIKMWCNGTAWTVEAK